MRLFELQVYQHDHLVLGLASTLGTGGTLLLNGDPLLRATIFVTPDGNLRCLYSDSTHLNLIVILKAGSITNQLILKFEMPNTWLVARWQSPCNR